MGKTLIAAYTEHSSGAPFDTLEDEDFNTDEEAVEAAQNLDSKVWCVTRLFVDDEGYFADEEYMWVDWDRDPDKLPGSEEYHDPVKKTGEEWFV